MSSDSEDTTLPPKHLEQSLSLGDNSSKCPEILVNDLPLTGKETLVKYSGKLGLFIPLDEMDEGTDSITGSDALVKTIGTLRQEIARLQEENLNLQEQLKEAKPSRTPDDFATAVSHSLDTLQMHMGQMTNSTSDFAVREFELDAKVFVDVTSLGTIEYRFIQPEDKIEPDLISNLNLKIVPVPKTTPAGSMPMPEFTPFVGIEEIYGIGKNYRELLNKHQIFTVNDLINVGTRVRSNVELASMLEVDRKRLDDWLSQAKLLTIRDINGSMANILCESGYDSLESLAMGNPEEIQMRYNERVKALNVGTVQSASLEQVKTWIKAAQAYTGKKADA